MSSNQFILNIEGPEVSPETVDIGELADVFRAIRGAVASIAEMINAENDSVSLTLVEVGHGSDKLTLGGSDLTLRSTDVLTRALVSSDFSKLPQNARYHLRNLWKTIDQNGWDSCSFLSNGSFITNAVISREHELFPDKRLFRGATTIYGECKRVGGSRKKAATIKLDNGKSINVHLRTEKLAKELGARLYQTVGLLGRATWEVGSHLLVEFVAESLNSYVDRGSIDRPRTNKESFDALSAAAGNQWDGVDADEFVREQRHD